MNLGMKNKLTVTTTSISNEFIDTYMASANGEYVKVYLYLLRHEREAVEFSAIADALNHTEADVRRAIAYWEKAGVLEADPAERDLSLAAGETVLLGQASRESTVTAAPETAGSRAAHTPALSGMPSDGVSMAASQTPSAGVSMAVSQTSPVSFPSAPPAPGDMAERIRRLSDEESGEFPALLYVVQQYLGKAFTNIECEKFAYFYDVLHMSSDLLEYLAEYCAGIGRTNIRYIEKVALNWYQLGIMTREEAKDYTLRYSRDMSAVMKAFGISGRNPGAAELEFMKKWFSVYGFDGKLVGEACNRTLTATGNPSFPYADKILSGWKENGVRTLADVEELDKRRQASRGREAGNAGSSQTGAQRKSRPASGSNRFKNFEERACNYEEMIWEGMKNRQKGGRNPNGTE